MFSTVRLANDEKYFIGATHTICYNRSENGKQEYYPLFDSNIIWIKKFLLKDVTIGITATDAGMRIDPFIAMVKKMYSHKQINWDTQLMMYILFEKCGPQRTEKIIVNQQPQLF